MVEKKLMDYLIGLAGGLLIDKVVEYVYVTSGAYAASGNRSWDDIAEYYAGIALTNFKKELGLGFLTGTVTGAVLSQFDIWLGQVLPPKMSLATFPKKEKGD